MGGEPVAKAEAQVVVKQVLEEHRAADEPSPGRPCQCGDYLGLENDDLYRHQATVVVNRLRALGLPVG